MKITGTSATERLLPIAAAVLLGCAAAPAGPRVLVEANASAQYLVNAGDPKIGLSWVTDEFDDSAWATGRFGIGREDGDVGGARALIETRVPRGTYSVYTRTRFVVDDPAEIRNLFLGIDYDDGFVAWINGHEVLRSDSMPDGVPAWNTDPESHESFNGPNPVFDPRVDLSARGIPLLRAGSNLLALGVWNHGPASSDLIVVPELRSNQPLETFVTRGPYLQSGTDKSVIVRWRTDKASDSRVAFGSRPDALDRAASDPQPTTRHRVRLSGLTPDTKLFYSVGSSTATLAGHDGAFFFRTAPRPGTRTPVRIWVVGDAGTAGYNVALTWRGFRKYIGERPTSLWLTMGDNAYPYGSDERYQLAFFNAFPQMLARSVAWSTVGNHDRPAPRGAYYDVFDFPVAGEAGGVASGTEAYYSFDFANIHFISLNSEEVDVARDSTMLEWLERDLAADRAEWIVAFWHHTPYSTGLHDSDEVEKMIAMRQKVLPLLDARGVDLVLTGHTHAYQRSFLLNGHYGASETLTPEMIVDGGNGREDGDGPYRRFKGERGAHGGIVYVVVGCSGEATERDLYHPVMPVGMTRRGSFVIEVDGDRLDGAFVDREGDVLDRFTILKDDERRPAPAADR